MQFKSAAVVAAVLAMQGCKGSSNDAPTPATGSAAATAPAKQLAFTDEAIPNDPCRYVGVRDASESAGVQLMYWHPEPDDVNCRLVPKETGVKGVPDITVSALPYDEREWDMVTDAINGLSVKARWTFANRMVMVIGGSVVAVGMIWPERDVADVRKMILNLAAKVKVRAENLPAATAPKPAGSP